MGDTLSTTIRPEDLITFKELPPNTLLDNIQIPEKPENRRLTDAKFIIVFVVILVLLFPFLIYTLIHSDIDRLSPFYELFYDQCGNFCGKKNSKQGSIDCSGQDYTSLPYLEFDGNSIYSDTLVVTHRRCVERCSSDPIKIFGILICFRRYSTPFHDDPYNSSFNKRSFEDSKLNDPIEVIREFVNELTEYLKYHTWRIVLACFLSLGVTLGTLALLRVATVVAVWGILGGVVIFGAINAYWLWRFCFYMSFRSDRIIWDSIMFGVKIILFFFNTLFTILLLLVLPCVMVCLQRKIQLFIQLLKESTKAAFSMPLLIFIPLITFFSEAIIVALFITTTVYMASSRVLTQLTTDFYQYEMNGTMIFTLIFNSLMFIWAIHVVIGIHYMVIAGAVATWYFSENKHNLGSPISKSAAIVFRFHLGSIFFGSLVITYTSIIRTLISCVTRNRCCMACVVSYSPGTIVSFIQFLSKNSYFMTAMHGMPFYKSGKRAAMIIFQNAVNMIFVNCIGRFILIMAQLFVVEISLLITAGIMMGAEGEYDFIVYVIVFIVSLAVAHRFFSSLKTVIDTIFLCFCEDSLLNDGVSRPYAMPRDLMEFVENSRRHYYI